MAYAIGTLKFQLVAVAAALIGCSTLCRAGEFSFTPLGYGLPNAAGLALANISGDGKTLVGTSYFDLTDAGYGSARAWVWTAEAGFQELSRLNNAQYTDAVCVNYNGSLVGGSSKSQPVLWSSGVIDPIDSAGGNAAVYKMSDSGKVLLGSNPAGEVYWLTDRVMHSLDSVSGGGTSAMSRDGQTLVGARGTFDHTTGTSTGQPMVWNNFAPHFLPVPFGCESAYAESCSADGSIIYGSTRNPNTVFRYFNNSFEDLGVDFHPQVCSADGSIVLGHELSSAGGAVVLWSRSTGMVRLQEFLQNHGADVSGWTLVRAVLSADGTTIAGQGINPQGRDEIWLATIDINPNAVDDVFVVDTGGRASGNVLANDRNEFQPVATLVSAPAHAVSFALNANGTFTYDPGTFSGLDKFTYRFTSDGKTSNVAVVNLYCHPILGVTVSPATVTGSVSSLGGVTLGYAAPTGGLTVPLTSSNPAVALVPASVAFLAGKTVRSFGITTKPVAAVTQVTISATVRGITKSNNITVVPPELLSLSLVNRTLPSGNRLLMKITLTGKTPEGGAAVNLTSSSSAMPVQPQAIIPEGANSVYVAVKCPTVAKTLSLTFTATYRGVTKSAPFSVVPASLLSIGTDASVKSGGEVLKVTVKLDGTAPSTGATVSLSSSDPAVVPLPASTVVAFGVTYKIFNVSVGHPATATKVTLTATYRGVAQSAIVQVQP